MSLAAVSEVTRMRLMLEGGRGRGELELRSRLGLGLELVDWQLCQR